MTATARKDDRTRAPTEVNAGANGTRRPGATDTTPIQAAEPGGPGRPRPLELHWIRLIEVATD